MLLQGRQCRSEGNSRHRVVNKAAAAILWRATLRRNHGEGFCGALTTCSVPVRGRLCSMRQDALFAKSP